MIFKTVVVGPMQVNCYILSEGAKQEAVIIDPGDQEEKIKKFLEREGLKPGVVINTHGHIDHIGCDDAFGVPVYAHAREVPLLEDAALNLSLFFGAPLTVRSKIHPLHENDEVTLDGVALKVLHVPGHTPGGVALELIRPARKIVFTGDSLFYGSVGRTDFPGADGKLLLQSIKEKLLLLADDTEIYPGHGPASTIRNEKKNNPYLK